MHKLSLFLLLGLLVSCGRSESSSSKINSGISGRSAFEPDSLIKVESLDGKSDEEILKLKYDNKVNLHCEVRVSKGEKIDLEAPPTDQFIWNLPQKMELMQILNFEIKNRHTITVIRLAGPLEFFDQLSHTDHKLKEYYMEHTPVLKILYKRGYKSMLFNWGLHKRESFKEKTLYENVEEPLYTVTSQVGRDMVTEDVRCSLMSEVKSIYADQWKVNK